MDGCLNGKGAGLNPAGVYARLGSTPRPSAILLGDKSTAD